MAARHGTAAAYRRGCRCTAARQDVLRYEKSRLLDILHGQSRTLPNIGVVRRLQALRALGYPSRDLARRIGVDERNMCRWPHRTWISRAHYDAVCRVYNELAHTTGPDTRSRLHAARQGWLPPLWWDVDLIDDPQYSPQEDFYKKYILTPVIDEIAIEQYIAGNKEIRLTRAEKVAAVQQLLSDGNTRTTIARTLRMSGAEVKKIVVSVGLDQDHAARRPAC